MFEELRKSAREEAFATQAAQPTARASRGRARSSGSPPIAWPTFAVIHHPRFVAVVSVWGAALLGGAVLALSSVDIARVSMVLGLGALGALAKLVYAAIAAVTGAIGGFAGARLIVWLTRFGGREPRRTPAPALIDDRVRPIDPALDLGSESLDAPLEGVPFGVAAPEDEASGEPLDDAFDLDDLDLDDLDLGDFDLDDRAILDAPPESDPEAVEPHPEPVDPEDAESSGEDAGVGENEDGETDGVDSAAQTDPDDPGLDLEALTRIVEEETRDFEARRGERQANGPSRSPSHTPSHTPSRGGSFFAAAATAPGGIARLRTTPPQDLSLVQLVERFAAALHDAQDKAPSEIAAGNVQRERALADALRALDMFTRGEGATTGAATRADGDEVSETERDLREALSRLQKVRGAA